MVHELWWSDDLVEEATRVRDDVEVTLAGLGIQGEVVLTGALSVPGALTRGDVDLHLRVAPGSFDDVVTRLRAVYPVASPRAWADTLAVFAVPRPRPTGLAVTPLGSEHDERFRIAWRALHADPALLASYNALKSQSVGTTDYEDRKSRFFTSVVEAWPDRSAAP